MDLFRNSCKDSDDLEGYLSQTSQATVRSTFDVLQEAASLLQQELLQVQLLTNENAYLKQRLQEYIQTCPCKGELHPLCATDASFNNNNNHNNSYNFLCSGSAPGLGFPDASPPTMTLLIPMSFAPEEAQQQQQQLPEVSSGWQAPHGGSNSSSNSSYNNSNNNNSNNNSNSNNNVSEPLYVSLAEKIRLPLSPGQAVQRPRKPFLPHITTIAVRNIPARHSQDALINMWPQHVYLYDFFYLPYNSQGKRGAGFVIINFVSHEAAAYFWQVVSGIKMPRCEHLKGLDVAVADVQGFQGNVEQYLRGKHLSQARSAGWQPAVFSGTIRLNFGSLPPNEQTLIKL
ncbi:unnamed protein product [Polarella glacialis]|uniref:Mei2-like C-terminal RNA recognition motif domain-containing protein n=1 Tax=Polarella glacialis TaxID=89957 RepID=A0A813GRS6_POLGL|nr:unnamed protein product [Polarella glacialis]